MGKTRSKKQTLKIGLTPRKGQAPRKEQTQKRDKHPEMNKL